MGGPSSEKYRGISNVRAMGQKKGEKNWSEAGKSRRPVSEMRRHALKERREGVYHGWMGQEAGGKVKGARKEINMLREG